MTGTAEASNPQVRNPIRPTPQVARSAPRTLSRRRHGFKSRWDYQGKRIIGRTRLHPGKGADTGIQDTPKHRSNTLIRRGHSSLVPHSSPQTTSPRHAAGRGLSPPAAPRRRHSLPSPVVFAPPFPRDDTTKTIRRRRPMLPQGIAAEDVGHPMRTQVDPRGALDHHSDRLPEEDDRDTGLRAELAVDKIHTTGGYGAGWCVLVRTVHSHPLLLPGRLAGNPACGP
jgi:hypothetical protein